MTGNRAPEGISARLIEALTDPDASIFVLTGAGISAAADIATYRGQGGLYSDGATIPLRAADARSNVLHLLWQTVAPLRAAVAAAEPTRAHRALAAAARAGRDITVVTQNVDGLHERAGSDPIALHGSLLRARCITPRCAHQYPAPPADFTPGTSGDVVRCPADLGRLRPDLVLFGESLDAGDLEAARQGARRADVALAVGTSLQVYPAASLFFDAVRRGAAGAWLDADPHRMRAEIADDDRLVLDRVDLIAGDCQQHLPALLGHPGN
jgi:NAD-dependent deacetylase